MQGGDFGARGARRCEGLRGVTRNVTRFGKHNYMRPGSVACHCVDIYAIKERKRAKQKEKEKRRTKISSPRKNIARCVMHERAYDSRRVNRLWIDAIKQNSVQKNSELEIFLMQDWRTYSDKRGRLSLRVQVFNFLQKRAKSYYLDTFCMTESQFVITLLEVDGNFYNIL